jgi:hypothetical protein
MAVVAAVSMLAAMLQAQAAESVQAKIARGKTAAPPANTKPRIVYMLAGGTDWSASNPWATKGTPIHEPPHWMVMWPVTAASGLATAPKNSGTWIMWAGTPYAHLMVNQKP